MKNDTWFEDGSKTILIALLTSGAVEFFQNKDINEWSIALMVAAGIGLLVLAYIRNKKAKGGSE